MMKFFLAFALLGVWCVKDSIQDSDQKVTVTLYYESLCPGCIYFITKQLHPAYQKIGSYLQLEMLPYGNAKRKQVGGKWQYKCQHGPPECAINKLEACGLAKVSDQDKQLEFVNCVESQDHDSDEKTRANACAATLGLTADQLMQCANGPEADDIFAKLADRTEKIQDQTGGVPAVFLNGKFDQEHHYLEDFLGVACKLLNPQPSGCKS